MPVLEVPHCGHLTARSPCMTLKDIDAAPVDKLNVELHLVQPVARRTVADGACAMTCAPVAQADSVPSHG